MSLVLLAADTAPLSWPDVAMGAIFALLVGFLCWRAM